MSCILRIVALLCSLGCAGGVVGCTGQARTADQHRIEFTYLAQSKLIVEDISPTWELGRMAAAPGEDRLFIITRTTAYFDLDDEGNDLPGTLRDRKAERLWVTIPQSTLVGEPVTLQPDSEPPATGYEVNNLDTKGYFRGPYVGKGFVAAHSSSPDTLDVTVHMEIEPSRPFRDAAWRLKGRFTIPRSQSVEQAGRSEKTKSAD